MAKVIKRILKRDTIVQKFMVPHDAKPVAFMNRQGEPSVYFETFGDDKSPQKEAALVMTAPNGETPPAKWCQLIGIAEFSGGQVVWACWWLPETESK